MRRRGVLREVLAGRYPLRVRVRNPQREEGQSQCCTALAESPMP